jgi:aldose 1-epimerase
MANSSAESASRPLTANETKTPEGVILRSASAEVEVDLFCGGRLRSLRIDTGASPRETVEVLWDAAGTSQEAADPLSWGSFVMAPFAGRIRHGRYRVDQTEHQLRLNLEPHSIHGTVFDHPWDLVEHTTDSLHCVTDLGEHWPYAGRCHQWISLGDNQLHFDLSVESHSESFGASIGWHPWFRTELATGEPLTLQAQPGLQSLRDSEGIPTTTWVTPTDGPWDDCFAEPNWPVTLSWGERLHLQIHSDCDYLVIFNELDHAWCVEPQTAPPNSFTQPTQWVDASHSHRARMTWSW